MIVDDIKKLILDRVPTSPEWAEFLGCSLVAVACGSERKIYSDIAPMGTKLNLFGVYIGPSGIAYKTVPLHHYLKPVLEGFEKKANKSVILPNAGSMEGYIEYLANKTGKYSNEGIIMKDEFSLMFKDARKDYMSDELELMSQFYDGWMQKRFTRKTGLDQPKDVMVSLVGTTTPMIYDLMKPDFFVQGLGNRICWIIYDNKQTILDDPLRYTYTWQRAGQYDQEIETITDFLMQIHYCPIKRMVILEDASALIEQYRKEVDTSIERFFADNQRDLRYLFLARQIERLIKFAGIHHMALLPTMEGIGHHSVEWALPIVRKMYSAYLKMLEDWQTKGKPVEIKTNEYYETAMLETIIKYTPCPRSLLYKKCQWGEHKIEETVVSLVAQGKIKFEFKQGAMGRPALLYSVIP